MLETPESASSPLANGAELLADVLGRIHLASAVFLRGEFSQPWAFVSTDAATLCQIVQPGARCPVPGARRLVLFHVAVEGEFCIKLESGEQARARPGDAVVLPYCDKHSMGFPENVPAIPIAQARRGRGSSLGGLTRDRNNACAPLQAQPCGPGLGARHASLQAPYVDRPHRVACA
jgi:hypothetical protein